MSSIFHRRHPNPDDLDSTDEENDAVDPELRLRTVRTAASTIAESIRQEQRAERRKTMRKKRSFFRRNTEKKRPHTAASSSKTESIADTSAPSEPPAAPPVTGLRRNIYVNTPLSTDELDPYNEPIARYVRNKVRTTMFPVFGAAAPQTAALPLLFILTVTAIKDGVEDYRRAILDEEVNTSASTKLGNWKNVNQPTDPRNWFEKLLNLNPPGKVTRGIKKLRERDAEEGKQIILTKGIEGERISIGIKSTNDSSSMDLPYDSAAGAGRRRLEDIQSVDSHSYPPQSTVDLNAAIGGPETYTPEEVASWRGGSGSLTAYQQSIQSRSSTGVVDYRKRITGSARWERTLWKKLEVGDIVLLRDNEQVPADIVVLSTSDPDNMCYLETKNLDGETNLKPRKSVKATAAAVSEEDIERISFVLDSEPPHANLYLYHGVLRYIDPNTNQEKQESVTINELLLRGCTVRNTAWIIGLVVFTGADSKIMLNGGDTPSKRSKIEKETNFNVIVNFLILIVMCLVSAIASGLFDAKTGTSARAFEEGVDPTSSYVVNALVTFTSCLIAFQNIVPISLYISIEIVKTIQAFFISQDIDMYYKPFDAACVPKTWNISDDLGQIEYVFSDKTGTLTQNVMEFQKCSVNGVPYGEGITEAQRGAAKREGREEMYKDPEAMERELEVMRMDMVDAMSRGWKNRYCQVDKLTLISPKLVQDLLPTNTSTPTSAATTTTTTTNTQTQTQTQRGHLIAFFRALAICHSVLADRPEPTTSPYLLSYKAESPDEAALVAAAREVGFPFVNKGKDYIDIEVLGQPERYIPLETIEFNSTRKRMSVVVRNPQGQIILYCKGADSVIYERLVEGHDPVLKEKTQKDMEMFANGGLRTLCIAYRVLGEQEYMEWQGEYERASNAVQEREEEMARVAEKVERDLCILGATALEDKLQEGVPEAIETLHKAGIKLWILTGDKVQTAIEIGFSCNLLKSDMEIMILSADTPEAAQLQIEGGLNKIASILGPPSLDPRQRGFVPGAQAAFAVVIDGDTLRHALSNQLKGLFLNLATQCETVVCCRVSPAQKALVVKLVKEGRDAMTLSIGDGANDVAMIQEANIGCGLLGHEGSQAAMSADYAFGQFRFLTKLLIVHGRWSYQRVADMHSNFFYKNVIWTFAMFWFLIFNSFDATYLYQYTFILLYNLVFTSLPVIALGAFDQDINAKAALAFPQLYIRGIRGLEYTRLKFWMYMLDGLYQSAVVFFIPYLVWTLSIASSWNGKTIESLADFGTTVSVAAIFSANTYVGMNTHYWTVITWVIVVGSSAVMVLWIVIYSFFPSNDFVDEVVVLLGSSLFWVTVFLAVLISLGPRYIVKFITNAYFPRDRDIVREMWVLGDLKDQLGIAHRKGKKRRNRALEQAPMFHHPHARSESEISSFQHDIELGSGPRAPSAVSGTLRRQRSQSWSPRGDSHPIEEVPNEDGRDGRGEDADADEYLSPRTRAVQASSPYSFRASYYSASAIPAPTPLPEVQNPNMKTVSPHLVSSQSQSQSQAQAQIPSSSSTPRAPYPTSRSPPATSQPAPEMYEMHVRSPSDTLHAPSPLGMHSDRGPSDASYATAYDNFDDGHDPDPSTWRESSYSSYGGGHAL